MFGLLNFLWGLLGFIITIAVLVTIHEWGHFVVARYFDVKILRFSLGFGKPIFSWTGKKDNTKYTISPIPLGGFVQMLGESDNTKEEEIPQEDKHRTFISKPAWQRLLIALAGPFVNFVFAVFAFALLFINGVQGVKPEIMYVAPNSLAAQAGLEKGDLLLKVNDKAVKLSVDADVAFAGSPRKAIPLEYQRDGQVFSTQIDLSNLKAGDELDMAKTLGLYGVDHWYQSAVVYQVVDGSAAQKMGLQAGDEILEIDGEKILKGASIYQVGHIIRNKMGESISIKVKRNAQEIDLTGEVGVKENKGIKQGFLGTYWDGRIRPDFNYLERFGIVEKYGIFSSLAKGCDKTVYYMKVTYTVLVKLVKRHVSVDNMGGPITIGDIAGKTIRIGWDVYLNFLGLVSLSLAVINLLPIPMLDGGHILFCSIEILRGGKKISQKITQWFYYIGAAIVLSFMGLIVLNDLYRYIFK